MRQGGAAACNGGAGLYGAGNDRVESLWVRIKRQANNVDVVMVVYYQPPSQDDDTNELFFKELRDTSSSATVDLMCVFNFPDIN